MKRDALSVLPLALGLTLLGTMRGSDVREPSAPSIRYDATASGTIGRVFTAIAPTKTHSRRDDERDLVAIRRRLRAGEAGTYINDILLERDSALARWPDRSGVPLTVWIQPAAQIRDFTSEFVQHVREAFQNWDELALPVRFVFVTDSSDAEVHVNWVDRFNEPISGRTRWARNEDWTITDANIILAVHHHQGEILDVMSMKAMALHEIGHLLGLDHTSDSTSIMAARVRVRELSDADRATVRLIYELPAGRLK
jgi:hypothetical protein